MTNRIFKKSNWMALLPAGILFCLLAASPVHAEYSGHVASFQSEKNAIAFVHKMKAKGLDAYCEKEDVAGKGTFYRTYIGRYKTLPLAKKALAKLKASGEIDYFNIQKIAEKKAEIAAKKTKAVGQKKEPVEKAKSTTETIAQKNEPVEKAENKIETVAQKNEPVQKSEVKVETAEQKKNTAPAIDTRHYYDGIQGIILNNGKVIKGQVISVDDDVLKIRTRKGKILTYSFTNDIKKYITVYEP